MSPQNPADPAPTISVVVPTFNRLARLRTVLGALADQDLDEPYEVIVVSDGSTDGTDEYLAGATVPLPIVPVFQQNGGPAMARNTGIERAQGELVVFIDDDVVAAPDLLRAHLAEHRRLGARSVVIGPMLDPVDHPMRPWVAWEQEMLAKQYQAIARGDYPATARQFYTGNASVALEHLRAAGGFDASLRRAEDVELAFRLDDLGLVFHFAPEARGYHYADRSFDAWLATARSYGRNDVVFARDRGRTWIYGFVRDAFRAANPLTRWTTRLAVRSDRVRRSGIAALSLVLKAGDSQLARRVQRYALSGVYAAEYHRGIAEELGGTAQLEALLADGDGP